MRLGIQTPQYSCTFDELSSVWQAAERLGFRSAWLMDHLEPIVAPSTEPMFEAWSILSALLARTESIRGAILVSANTMRHPSITARMAATIDQLSRGRLEVGLGAAWCAPEHAANGIAFPTTKDRLDMLDEACHVMRALWTAPRANFSGRHYQLVDAACEPKPVQTPLPLLIGGRGEKRTLKITAQHAQRWNGAGSIEMLRHSQAVLAAHCEAVGRDPASVELTVRNDFLLSDDRVVVEAKLTELAAFAGQDAAWARPRNFVGGRSEVLDRLGEFAAAGFHEALLCLAPPYGPATVDILETVAAEFMPALA